MTVVIISDRSDVNAVTGEVTQSSVYHYVGPNPVCSVRDRIEVPFEIEEKVAQAFGRKPCGTCTSSSEKQKLVQTLFNVVPMETLLNMVTDMDAAVPGDEGGFEVRILWHPPGHNISGNPLTPRVIWTTWTELDPE